jgi:hypothetical protein
MEIRITMVGVGDAERRDVRVRAAREAAGDWVGASP